MKKLYNIFILMLLAVFVSCGSKQKFQVSSPAVKGSPETGFYSKIKSTGRIDSAYAAGDKDPRNTRSLPLEWKQLPKGTKYLAFILDDPDAKPVMEIFGVKGDAFLHWTAADIDPSVEKLDDNASAMKKNLIQGTNSAGMTGYVGPRPPSDLPKDAKKPIIHIYRLKLYALSAPTGLKEGFTLSELQAAIKDKVLGVAELNFSYSN